MVLYYVLPKLLLLSINRKKGKKNKKKNQNKITELLNNELII